ncbi:MAG: adenylyltransferase/cytidyltransferase family protein [Patescibacteria group bacterium]|nr:adenylyltransferase/cytidyltransferase family protein [Patescibacteria group bacterium]
MMQGDISTEKGFGALVGRFSPMHLGHQRLIEQLIATFGERHLILVGSCNHAVSFRHLFTYNDRCEFIRAVYPQAHLVGLPDFDENAEWFNQLDDTLALANANPSMVTYVGGCQEDVEFFIESGRRVHILNRFSGETPHISATEVRDALIEHRPIDGLIDLRIVGLVKERFDLRWSALRKK